MYGVPTDLDLHQFCGDEIVQIGIGQHNIQFNFSKGGQIQVLGAWELRSADGELIDGKQEHVSRTRYNAHVLLGIVVTSYKVDPPSSFTLMFENGMTLTVHDDSEQYESFSVQPGDIFV